MKVLLIAPSNTLFMPYLKSYTSELNFNNIEYEIVLWDRFGFEENVKHIYRDKKKGHRRNLIDYFKFSKYIIEILDENNYDKIVVFGLQVLFTLRHVLPRKYNGKYIVDIRDYHKIIKLINMKKICLSASHVVLSSEGYLSFLPKINNYIVNHNITIKSLADLESKFLDMTWENGVSIGCIGAIRDKDINLLLMKSIKTNKKVTLNFNGEGIAEKYLIELKNKMSISNVNITGKYAFNEEKELYMENDMINVLRFNSSLNNRLALPNRLYKAAQYGIPLLAFEGTYLAEIIEKYYLGLVIDSFDNIGEDLFSFFETFDRERYNIGRTKFLKIAIKENNLFVEKLKEILI